MTFDQSAPEHETWPTPAELQVARLGECTYPSEIVAHHEPLIEDTARVLLGSQLSHIEPFLQANAVLPSFERAGPRRQLFFDPNGLGCGIVTCGGICPGLNNVIRAITFELYHAYGIRRILGFRYGYDGLAFPDEHPPLQLAPDLVGRIHDRGGTILGSSRGPQDLSVMVDNLVRREIGILFVIGGDGGLRGAAALAGEIARRGLPISVIGVPKTIDNDLQWTTRTFGFDTAVEAARQVITAAHNEAQSAWNGVSLVKLMGRHSGFIAAAATLANADVNYCLIPEAPFALEGNGGFLDVLERRLETKHHAVIVAAEGAGQELIPREGGEERDASGNVKLRDIGTFLRDRIGDHFKRRRQEVTIRYIDPSYTIRSTRVSAFDAQLCLILGQYAVHAGMAGRTNMVVGVWNQQPVHVPIAVAIKSRRLVDPTGELWQRVLATTGQPERMVAR